MLFDQGQAAASFMVRSTSVDLPTVYLIDANGMIRNSWANSVLTKDIFEGNGLAREIDRLMAAGTPGRSKIRLSRFRTWILTFGRLAGHAGMR